jgi:hypothetical protein
MPKSFCSTCGTAYEYVGARPNFSPACGHAQSAFASQPVVNKQVPQYSPRYAPARQPIYQEPEYFEEPYIDPDLIEVSINGQAPEPVKMGQVLGMGPSNIGNRPLKAVNKTDFKKLLKKMEPGKGRDFVEEV